MATKPAQIVEFETDKEPSSTDIVELLCEDHRGTYLLPFPCHRAEQSWWNGNTGEKVEARVVGWRLSQQ